MFEIVRGGLAVIYFVIALFLIFSPPMIRYQVIRTWSILTIKGLSFICGITYRVKGYRNIPDKPAIIVSNHQSAWETIAYQVIFPPQVWIIKRELLKIPFFGWGLGLLSPIAIDRKSTTIALRQTVQQGRDRLSKRFSIIVFPEGTRLKKDEVRKYQIGGAYLAHKTGTSIVPVAHNAGDVWAKNSFIKYPGTITVSVGAEIRSTHKKPKDLMHEAEEWIRNEVNSFENGRKLKYKDNY